MKYSFFLIITLLSIIVLASPVLGEIDESLYIFQRASCDCYDGLELIDTTLQGSLLGCTYWEDHGNEKYLFSPEISTETWAYISVPKRLPDRKEYYQKEYDRLHENYVFEEFYIEENKTAMIYQKYKSTPISDEPVRTGGLLHHYRGYSISIYSDELDWNPKEDFEQLDECMMKAVDQAILRQEAKDSNKPKLTFTLNNRPLKNLYINSDVGGYYSDENGIIRMNDNVAWVDIYFKYVSDKPVFTLLSPDGEELLLDMRVKKGKITSLKLDVGSKSYDMKIADDEFKNFNIEDYVDQIGSYLYNYVYFQDAAEYYESLGVEFTAPVDIIIHDNYKNKAAYINNEIHLDKTMASPTSPQAPYTQYHEFAHFVMHTLYGQVFADISKEKNHGGFANPTTGDSWVEGFAAFMAVQTANYQDHYWAKYPSETNPSTYPFAGSLENNYQAWEIEGYAEEFAIASFLWDLIDDADDVVDERDNLGLDMAFSWYFKSADENRDDIVTKEEYILHHLRNSGNAIELDEVDWLGMIDYGQTLQGVYDVKPDMTLFDAHEGDDGVLSTKELIALADIMKYEHKDEIATRWIEVYDEDKDHQISQEEASKLLEGYEVIKFLSEGEELLELEDLKVLSLDPTIQDVYWTFEQDAMTYEELFKELTAKMVREDDENLNMDFDVLWKIMINKHKDFTSFTEELAETNDDRYKEKLAYSLLDHGLYADLSMGNGAYEAGVEAFIDTNNDGVRQASETFIDYPFVWNFDEKDDIGTPTTYERPERRSSPQLPGHYVEGAQEVAYFMWDGPVLREVISFQTDEYVPVPPGAQVYVANEKSVAHFSEEGFTNDYVEIKEKGYITKLSTSRNSSSFFIWMIVLISLGAVSLVITKKQKGKKKKK